MNQIQTKKEAVETIVEHLRADSRMSILEISRKIGIPKSTVYDYYKKLRERFWFTVVERASGQINSQTKVFKLEKDMQSCHGKESLE